MWRRNTRRKTAALHRRVIPAPLHRVMPLLAHLLRQVTLRRHRPVPAAAVSSRRCSAVRPFSHVPISISRQRPTIRRRRRRAMPRPARATCRLTRSTRNSTARRSIIAAKKAGHHRHRYAEQISLSGRRERQGAALWHRRRPSGLHLGRREDDHRQARMAGLATAGGHAATAARSAAFHARRYR